MGVTVCEVAGLIAGFGYGALQGKACRIVQAHQSSVQMVSPIVLRQMKFTAFDFQKPVRNPPRHPPGDRAEEGLVPFFPILQPVEAQQHIHRYPLPIGHPKLAERRAVFQNLASHAAAVSQSPRPDLPAIGQGSGHVMFDDGLVHARFEKRDSSRRAIQSQISARSATGTPVCGKVGM